MVELGLIPAPAQGREANPRTFFGEVLFAGGYGQGWEALKAGQVDATVIAGDVAERLYREVIDGTRQIEKQGPIPSHGVAVARQLSPEKRTQLIDALMKLNDPQHRPLMRQFISAIFVSFAPTTTEEHLKTLQTYLQETGFQYTESLR
jgi:phosphonate transport system substrate-binding protein